MFVCEVC